jgi:hypothetical protein
MKPVLMIHEVNASMFSLPLENYVLTFDDGLYSQFYYFDRFKSIPTRKIFFISSNIICDGVQSLDFPTCAKAHQKAFAGNKEDYMTVPQIQELMSDPLVSIGGHGHSHTRLSYYSKLTEKIAYIKKDTEEMLSWFKKTLGCKPIDFCFPYNDDFDGVYGGILKHYGFVNFYGRERIPVEKLLQS